MARKFSGRFSPGGAPSKREPTEDQRIEAAGARAGVMFLPAIPLVFLSFGSPPAVLAVALAGAGVLTLAAWLLREGLKAEEAWAGRKIARRPAVPRKMFSSVLTGLGIAMAAWTGSQELIGPVIYGVIAGALHVAAFGIDPLKSKVLEGVDTFQQDRVARVTDEARENLTAMRAHVAGLGERSLTARADSFAETARRMIRTVEEDPRDLTGARKYLSVYLTGARDAAAKFADVYARDRAEADRAQFLSLLDDLERNFAAQTTRMLSNERSDMDIEIKVLRDRLHAEGVAAGTSERTDR